MTVIDVDSHVEPAPGWLDEFPDLRRGCPSCLPDPDPRFAMGSPEMFAWFVSDDLLRGVPPREADADGPARHRRDAAAL